MKYKKVIIFGQAFNNFSGGGITLSNLFKDWPIGNLAVVSYPFMLHNASTNLCRDFYQIGSEELTWRPPFSLIKQKFPSGRIDLEPIEKLSILRESGNLRHLVSNNILTPLIKWSGMVHWISTIDLSQKLKDWLLEFAPDILYLQISNRESINFAIELIDYLKIPSVIHMMDDWPSTISSNGLFKRFWHKKIDKEFRQLIKKIDIHLSISEAMSEAYQDRYNTSFRAFHNPAELDQFNFKVNSDRSGSSVFRVLYMGRIGTANKESIMQFARFISGFEPKGYTIEFDVYTKDVDARITRKLGKLHKINVRSSIEHSDIPLVLMSYDLLLLPLDFTKAGLAFSRYSIPTKASEYMMSGTPILVFAPSETAISSFFARNKCGHCLTSNKLIELREALDLLIGDKEYRKSIGERAILTAKQKFDARVVRNDFMSLLSTMH